MLHFWGGRAVIDALAYPDLEEFWNDAIAIWQAEIRDLHALGCSYVQIDDVTFPLICDPRCQEALKQRGFASNFMGNPLTVEDERRKLSLVVETAREVWG